MKFKKNQNLSNNMNKTKEFFSNFEPTKLIFLGYLFYIILGWILLSIPNFQNQNINSLDSLFVSASAISTTGLSTVNISETFNGFGQLVILSLIQLGGLGYMTFGSFIILSRKNTVSKTRENILKSSFSLPEHFNILKFVKSIVKYTIFVELIGAISLYFVFLNDNRANPIWSAIFHSISAFCTAGFSLYANGFENYIGNFWLNFIISILSILGAIGYIVIIDFLLMIKGKNKKMTFTSKVILSMTAWILSVGTVVIFIIEDSFQVLPAWERLMASFFQVMTALTTVGFNTFPIGMLNIATLFLTIIFMIIGASPSGTGGGVKSTTISAVIGVLNSVFKKEKEIKFIGRIIPYERVIYAVCSFVFYILILFFGIFLISLTDETLGFYPIFFESASALGTVGLSTGITSNFSELGKLFIILLMFIGRLGAISFGMVLFYKVEEENDPVDIVI
jgi:trk system potassium uptake protein TrkH